jgi:hypothetical protein
MKMSRLKVVITSVAAVLLAACAAEPRQIYSGARLSPEKEVRITTESEQSHGALAPGFDRKIYLVKINGQSLTDGKALIGGQMDPYPIEAYALPGRIDLDIRYRYLNRAADGKLWFDGEAGKEYRVRYRIDGYKLLLWVEDVTSGKPVGGVRE